MAFIKFTPEDATVDSLIERDDLAPIEAPKLQEDNSFIAGFKQTNPYASAFSYGIDPGNQTRYDFRDDIKGTPFESMPKLFIDSDSPEESQQIKERILNSQKDREIMNSSVMGYAGAAVGALADPLTFAPFIGQAWKYGQFAKSAAQGAAGLAAANTVQESLLYPSQPNKPIEDIYAAAITGAVFGGVAGTGLAYIGKSKLNSIQSEVAKILKESFDPNLVKQAGATELEGISNTTANVLSPTIFKSASIEGATASNDLIRKLTFDVLENNLLLKSAKEGVATPTALETLVDLDRTRIHSLDDSVSKAYLASVGKESQVTASIHNVINKEKIMTRQEFADEIGKAMRNGDMHENVHVQALAKEMRKTIDEANVMLKKAGLKEFQDLENLKAIGADSYLTRIYKRSAILSRGDEFIELVSRELRNNGTEDALARTQAIGLRDHILKQPMDKTDLSSLLDNMLGETASPNFAKEKINIQDKVLQNAGFLINDGQIITSQYYQQASRIYRASQVIKKYVPAKLDEAGKEIVAPPSTTELRKLVMQEYKNKEDLLIGTKKAQLDEQVVKGTLLPELAKVQLKDFKNKLLEDSSKVIAKEQEFLDDLLHMMMGTHKKVTKYDEALAWLRTWNTITKMGSATLASLTDVTQPIVRHGFGRTLHAWHDVLSDFAKGVKGNVDELKHATVGIDEEMNTIARSMLDDDFYSSTNNMSGKVRGATTNAFFTMNAMKHWTKFNERIAATTTKSRIMEDLFKYAELPEKEVQYLASIGLGKKEIQRILAQKQYFVEKDGGRLVQDQLWTDREIADIFNAAILKDTRSMYLSPTLGDKPRWASKSSLGATLNQFKSFFEAFTARVLIPSIQRRDAKVLLAFGGMVTTGAMVYMLQMARQGKEIDTSPENLILEGMSRSGVLGVVGELGYFTGTNVGLIQRGTSRYFQSNLVEYLGGASVGLLQDVWEIQGKTVRDLKDKGELSQSSINAWKKLMPLNNLFYLNYLNQLMDDGEDK